jgi:hypothetical protein
MIERILPTCACLVVAVAANLLSASSAQAVESVPATRIRYDVETRAFSARLPHGTPFLLDIAAPPGATGALVQYAPAADGTCPTLAPVDATGPTLGVLAPAPSGSSDQVISTQIDKLAPNTEYCFWITVLVQWSEIHRKQFAAALVDEIVDAVKQQNATISEAQVSDWIRKALGDLGGLSDVQVDTEGLVDRIRKKTYGDLTKAVNAANKYVEQEGNWERDKKMLADAPAALTREKLGGNDPSKLIQSVQALIDLQLPDPAQPLPNPAELTTATAQVKAAEGETSALLKSACSGDAVASEGCPVLRSLSATLPRVERRATSLLGAWSDLLAALSTFQQLSMRVALAEPVSKLTVSSPAGFMDRAPLYISGNIGMAAVHFRNDGWDSVLFVGVNLYFAALDKDIPLGTDLAFRRRFSIVAGYTINDLNSPSGTGRGALGGKGALLGASLRVTDYLQMGAGAALVRQASANPLVASPRLRTAPYASLSIDIDVVDIVKGIFAKAK